MSARLLQARDALRQAERDYQQMLAREYPVGKPVRWERTWRIRAGVVVSHGYCGRVCVRPTGAVRPYWISADDIARAAELDKAAAA